MPYEKRAGEPERRAYDLFLQAQIPTPTVLGYDEQTGILRLEDLRATHATDWAQAERMIDMAADLHAAFWDSHDVFGSVGLPWRLDCEKNFKQHCKAMEKHMKAYCKAHGFDSAIFRQALTHFRSNMLTRINGKNITIIHGDLHPGNVLLSEGSGVFIDLEAVRMGLGTEDLAMLLALHIAPEKARAMPLLERYHARRRADGYPFEALLADYRLALSEALFFPMKLYADGIDDVTMMERAMKAWNDFVG